MPEKAAYEADLVLRENGVLSSEDLANRGKATARVKGKKVPFASRMA